MIMVIQDRILIEVLLSLKWLKLLIIGINKKC